MLHALYHVGVTIYCSMTFFCYLQSAPLEQVAALQHIMLTVYELQTKHKAVSKYLVHLP
jgi:hypothetical protein